MPSVLLERAYVEAVDVFLGSLPHSALPSLGATGPPAAPTPVSTSPPPPPAPGGSATAGASSPAAALLAGQLRLRAHLQRRLAPPLRVPPERATALVDGATPAWSVVGGMCTRVTGEKGWWKLGGEGEGEQA